MGGIKVTSYILLMRNMCLKLMRFSKIGECPLPSKECENLRRNLYYLSITLIILNIKGICKNTEHKPIFTFS